MFWIFLIGIIAMLRVLLYLDIIVKDKTQAFDYRLLVLVFIAAILAFYIFYIRAVEDRWVFLLLPFMCLVCAAIMNYAYEWICSKDLKWVAIILIILLMGGMAYEQIKYAGAIMEVKKGSYHDVKLAAEWMAANSVKNEGILSISYPQTVWYSGRNVMTYSQMNVTTLEEYIHNNHPTFLTISIYEPHPQWIYEWVSNESNAYPVNAYYLDLAKTQPSLVVYRLI
jgi:hypothetical protein